jgi:hypothetical protein
LLYHSGYVFVFLRAVLERLGLAPKARGLSRGSPPGAVVVLPTLLSKREELEGLKRALLSVLNDGYPGELIVAVGVDHAGKAPELTASLLEWARQLRLAPKSKLIIAPSPDRRGKATATEWAINAVQARMKAGSVRAFPEIFFNMDADSALSPGALERMAARLMRRSWISGERPMIVASNVCVKPSHYWKGWRHFFTVRGQLALQVAREYLVHIGVSRHNRGFMPTTGVSGALYCTWSELYLQASRFAGFIETLRVRDVIAWWLGRAPPSFARSGAVPLPEAMTGPADDTWVTWFALAARWKNGRISVELPRTPLHALWDAIHGYIFRPVAYDLKAKVYTTTHTTIVALFRQRIRWNSSRHWLAQRVVMLLLFNWRVGAVVTIDFLLTFIFHGVFVLPFVVWPFTSQPIQWLALAISVSLCALVLRVLATLLGILQDPEEWAQWRKLLALPLSGVYHTVFNTLPALVGHVADVLLFGVDTAFTPERTLIRGITGRIAIAYRIRRALYLSVRALIRGDVPFGSFWFGWHETPWTYNGYAGWGVRGGRRMPALKPRPVRALPDRTIHR